MLRDVRENIDDQLTCFIYISKNIYLYKKIVYIPTITQLFYKILYNIIIIKILTQFYYQISKLLITLN